MLSSNDLARLEALSRTLLSPLGAATPEAWMHQAGRELRALLSADGVVLQLPSGGFPFFTEDAPEVVAGIGTYFRAMTDEGARFTDPVVDLWNQLRREAGQEAFTWQTNAHTVGAHGHRMEHSPIVAEGLIALGYQDFGGLMARNATGEAMLWALHGRAGAVGPGALPLLRLLAPSFQAGFDALGRLGAQRAALDAVGEPLAAFDAAGRELHRSPALGALLVAEPDRGRLEVELRALVLRLRPLAFPLRHRDPVAPAPAREVRTARGAYTLRATLLPAGALGAGEALLVTVAAEVAAALPAADEVRARHGLSRREAEVALVVAEGLTNEAVAERLFISPNTVRHHVERVLAKLEVPSRAAVAARLMGAA